VAPKSYPHVSTLSTTCSTAGGNGLPKIDAKGLRTGDILTRSPIPAAPQLPSRCGRLSCCSAAALTLLSRIRESWTSGFVVERELQSSSPPSTGL